MKTLVTAYRFASLSLVYVLLLSACGGGGGGGVAAIPPSAPPPVATAGKSTTTGAITGFGSVIVNGIEFNRKTGLADDKVQLKFEGLQNQAENTLKVGMVVKIVGTYDSATGKGEYEAIEFQPEMRGRLDNNGVDLVNGRITVMGRPVQVDAATHFDSIRDLAELAGIQGVTNANHPEIEVSGNLDNNGVLHATRIAKKADDFLNGNAAQLKGSIAASPAPTITNFTIGSTAVVVDGTTVFANMVRADLATSAGAMIEAKGTLSNGVFTATRIEKKQAIETQVNDNVKVKGIAVGAVSSNTFTLSGPNGPITVNTAGASFLKGGVAATSAIVIAGAQLQVEGSMNANGAIVATKVSVELEKNLKLEGDAGASAYNASTRKLTLNGISVNILPTTRLNNAAVNPATTLDLATVAAGDHLQVTGYVDAAGAVIASQVQKTAASKVTFIQGPVSAKTATTLTILGIVIDSDTVTQSSNFIDNSNGSEVPGTGTVSQARSVFMSRITVGTSEVKAKGTINGTSMSASELEQKNL